MLVKWATQSCRCILYRWRVLRGFNSAALWCSAAVTLSACCQSLWQLAMVRCRVCFVSTFISFTVLPRFHSPFQSSQMIKYVRAINRNLSYATLLCPRTCRCNQPYNLRALLGVPRAKKVCLQTCMSCFHFRLYLRVFVGTVVLSTAERILQISGI